MPLLLTSSASSALPPRSAASFRALVRVAASADADAIAAAGDRGGFPPFLPREVERIRDGAAVRLAKRIERVPVQTGFSKSPILSSCVRPLEQQQGSDPVVLLHGFDSSCLEWTYTYPLLEEAGLEAWAVDILGWGFSDLETRPPCDVVSKREHLYQFWKSYIKRPMVLVGPSLGAAVAIDFSVNYPEAVSKLIFIGASVYSEGPKYMTRMPIFVSYAGVSILKSLPLRLFATHLAFNNIPGGFFDWLQISRLHCLLPWWEDATVDFMIRGGYNVINQIKQVKHKCLILWGEDDGIISSKLAYRLHQELPDAILRQVPQCGHIPHVEKPREVAKHVLEFLARSKTKMSC
ncbi:alpha/beta hydrolase domain-containing protein VTE7-like isoform X2 [Phragmites australis]|uniref:alpha/beta hydrolase domain-containing protein VTE7-like isoform X2 n=1 Tax=Phragmites australis TaxID=29695 RepID=UPI002D77DEC8|nr:alpha/beta hydrolase domain-containing protein VTE7-like isoform X2 [Phragmites australis]